MPDSLPRPRPTPVESLRIERERLLRHLVNVELARHDAQHRSRCLPRLPSMQCRLLYYEAVHRVESGMRQPHLLQALHEAYADEDEGELRAILGCALADDATGTENPERTRLRLTVQNQRLRLHLDELALEGHDHPPPPPTLRGPVGVR